MITLIESKMNITEKVYMKQIPMVTAVSWQL